MLYKVRYMYWFFPQSVLLQPLKADLVRTNNTCFLGFVSNNL